MRAVRTRPNVWQYTQKHGFESVLDLDLHITALMQPIFRLLSLSTSSTSANHLLLCLPAPLNQYFYELVGRLFISMFSDDFPCFGGLQRLNLLPELPLEGFSRTLRGFFTVACSRVKHRKTRVNARPLLTTPAGTDSKRVKPKNYR